MLALCSKYKFSAKNITLWHGGLCFSETGQSEFALLGDIVTQLSDGNPNLLHGVTVTDGDAIVGRGGLVAYGLEVHGDAQRGTDFVLTAVTLADGASIVEVHHKVLLQLTVDLLGLGAELLGKGQHGRLDVSLFNYNTFYKIFHYFF